MKKSEIRVGGTYDAIVNGKMTQVRIERVIDTRGDSGRMSTQYIVTNLATQRKTIFRSARRFRGESQVADGGATLMQIVDTNQTVGSPGTTTRVPGDVTEDALLDQQVENCSDSAPVGKSRDTQPDWTGDRCEEPDESLQEGTDPPLTSGEAEEILHPEATADRLLCEERGIYPPPTLHRGDVPQSSPPEPSGLARKLAAGRSSAGPPHLIIRARAGTGKTSVIVGGLYVMRGMEPPITPSLQQDAVWVELARSRDARTIGLCAFNNSIAGELKSRLAKSGLDQRGCEAMTLHSLGYKAVRRAFPGVRVPNNADDRVNEIISELIGEDLRLIRRNRPVVLKATRQLVALCKQNLIPLDIADTEDATQVEDILSRLASHYDVSLTDDDRPKYRSRYGAERDEPITDYSLEVFDLVPRVLERCRDVSRDMTCDFNDMIWLPVVLDLPVFRYDVLLVDECLPGWTPVMLADGRSMTIKEIVDCGEEVRVRSYDTEKGVARNCLVTGKHRITNQKPLVKVKVRHLHRTGTNRKCNFVVCTEDHKVWTINRGWVEAGELHVGDDVIVETAARTTQKGKVTAAGRKHLSSIQRGNERGLGNVGGDPEKFNRNKGGNGRGLTLAENTLLDALGKGWGPVVVRTGYAPQYDGSGMPSHYKIDLANRDRMIAVEVDGGSHSNPQIKEKDSRKQQFLEDRGWKVVRVSNRRAIQDAAAVACEISGDCPRPARVVGVEAVTIQDSYVYDVTVDHCHNFYANGILVHNCQDLNRCQQSLARKAGRRLVLCGDDRQSIYGFAGADSESIPRMEKELSATPEGCIILPLTVTRRCGRAIVAEARRIVSDFEAHESVSEGKVREARYPLQKRGKDDIIELKWEETYGPMVQDGDMVLCRCNAPLVRECFRFLKRGRRAKIQGRNVGQGLRDLAERLGTGDIASFIAAVTDWAALETRREEARRSPDDGKLIGIRDRMDCLLAFADGAATVTEVMSRIDSVFTDDPDAPGVKLSSVHRAKGLESRRVFFLRPYDAPCPHPMARSRWQQTSEDNILYVGVTRAIEELVYVY